MKANIINLVIFMVILYFNFLLQGAIIISAPKNNEDYQNIKIPSIANNVLIYEWNCTWGGISNDMGMGAAIDSLDNIYIAGSTISYGAGEIDMVLVKYNRDGVLQWNHTWGGSRMDHGNGVVVDSSGDVYLMGTTGSFGAGGDDIILIKYDKNGMIQWNRTWGGEDPDDGFGMAVDSSNNVYLVGTTHSFGVPGNDIVLVKYDVNGEQQWNRTWGGEDGDGGYGVAVDSFDNVYLTGRTWCFGAGSADIVLVKYDGSGTQKWNHTWGGTDIDWGWGMAIDSSDNVYIVGYTNSFGMGGFDICLLSYDVNGSLQWNRTWGGDDIDSGMGVALDSFGNLYLAGSTESFGAGDSSMVLMKYDGNGTQQWYRIWGGLKEDIATGIVVDSSDNVYLVGSTTSFGAGGDDIVLVKYVNEEVGNYKQAIFSYHLLLFISAIGILTAIRLKKNVNSSSIECTKED